MSGGPSCDTVWEDLGYWFIYTEQRERRVGMMNDRDGIYESQMVVDTRYGMRWEQGCKSLNWQPFEEEVSGWQEVSRTPATSTVWEDMVFSQIATDERIVRTGERNDRGEERNVDNSVTQTRQRTIENVSGTKPLNWHFWETRPIGTWYDWTSWSPAPSGYWFWEDVLQSITRRRNWEDWRINDRGDSQLILAYFTSAIFNQTVKGTKVPVLSAFELNIPGTGGVRAGINGNTVTLPNGTTITGNTSGSGSVSIPASVIPGGVTVTTTGGTISVTSSSGTTVLSSGGSVTVGGVTISVTPAGRATLTLPGNAEITVGTDGGSVGLPGGWRVRVATNGRVDLDVPPGTSTVVAKAIDLAGVAINAAAGHVISVRDAIGLIVGPLPSNPLLGTIDIGVTLGGVVQLGQRQGTDGPYVWPPIYVQPTPPQLAVDANRDGTVSFANADGTSGAVPYRFWLNDDDDAEFEQNTPNYDETEQDDKEVTSDVNKDWNNLFIDKERDLEDLARLWINTAGLTDALKNGSLRLGLKWADVSSGTPAVRMFKAVESNGGNAYLFNSATATLQVDQSASSGARGIAVGNLIDGTNPVILPTALFANLSESQPRIYLLFEGAREGRGQLKIVVLNQNNQPIGDNAGVWMELLKPHNFVERFTSGESSGGAVAGSVTMHSESGPMFAAPLADEERDYVLYVHGYNMQLFEKQRWLETTYKRLYWLGYKGRVGGFSWPCTFGAVGQAFFDVSERRAWESGARLNEHIQSLNARGYRVHLIAHSQGNVAAAEALRLWRGAGNATPLVRTYIASQAAIPAACYNPNAPWMPNYDKTVIAGVLTTRDPLAPDIYARYWRSGDDDRLPNAWPSSNPSYLSNTFMTSAASRWVNFYNISDYALTGNSLGHPGWEIDQRQKPTEWLNQSFLNSYSYSHSSGFQKWYGPPGATIVWSNMRFSEDRYEIFSYGAGTWSLALGTIPTGGVFSNFTNLQSSFQYGSEHRWHSGQFRSFNAARYQYWGAVLDAALIPHFNP